MTREKDWQRTVYTEKARPSSYLRHDAESFSMIELLSGFSFSFIFPSLE